ncbi:MAG: hypothetical protein R3E86_16905 [Pseudomonadales bacterium]
MAYLWAWLVVAGFALAGLFCLFMATRGWRLQLLRRALFLLAAVVFLLPAPIPRHDADLAPAFVVFLFEWLFQPNGEPEVAGRILLAGVLGALAALILGALLSRRRRAARGQAGTGET